MGERGVVVEWSERADNVALFEEVVGLGVGVGLESLSQLLWE